MHTLTHRTWKFLLANCLGRSNAKTKAYIAPCVGLSPREFESIVHDLITLHLKPVCAACETPFGYFVPQTQEELEDAVGRLRHRAGEIQQRARRLEQCEIPKPVGLVQERLFV